MPLFTIADLHLSLQENKPMDIFGGSWQGYVDKLRANWIKTVGENDTVVIPGDLTWSMTLQNALADFVFLESLPGSKILLKGNHDYYFQTRAKLTAFFEINGIKSIDILHNNYFEYEDIALCGTRGWTIDPAQGDEDVKILNREIIRLAASLDAAGDDREKIVFLHFPPVYRKYACQPMLELFDKHGVKRCYYGHLHAGAREFAFEGTRNGVEYKLVSGDNLDFLPCKVL